MLKPVNLQEKFALFSEPWSPRIAAQVNDALVKLVKFKGEFVWHRHEREDELFLVVSGGLRIKLRDGEVRLGPGEFVVVPRGVEHLPVADEETLVVLIEPASTLNTGDVRNERTLHELKRI